MDAEKEGQWMGFLAYLKGLTTHPRLVEEIQISQVGGPIAMGHVTTANEL